MEKKIYEKSTFWIKTYFKKNHLDLSEWHHFFYFYLFIYI